MTDLSILHHETDDKDKEFGVYSKRTIGKGETQRMTINAYKEGVEITGRITMLNDLDLHTVAKALGDAWNDHRTCKKKWGIMDAQGEIL